MPTASTPVFDSGLEIEFLSNPLGFRYGPHVFGPKPEYRSLDTIRPSLKNPHASGPDPVYAIAMDVGHDTDRSELQTRMLLFGIVIYAAGRLGEEPVRSQGHVHAISPHCGWSTPELFEIWRGQAIVFGQEFSGDDPGRCIAVAAGPGDRVVIPPKWAHYVVNASTNSTLVFGAWCDRQYGFDYRQMRTHQGLAWFPLMNEYGEISWMRNSRYKHSVLESRAAREYPELGLQPELPIYRHLNDAPDSIQWVSDPARLRDLWPQFEP